MRRERLVSVRQASRDAIFSERRMQMGATAVTTESIAERREPELKPTAAEPRPGRERSNSGTRPAEEPTSRRGSKRRRAAKEGESAGTVRYFLTKPSNNGTPELGEEMPDEHQALLAAHKADRSFVTVEEWTAKADRRKGITILGKDPVVRH
jgi:hypothetical protein